jgi:hypothetical protein
VDQLAADFQRRAWDEARSQQEELRTQTSEERAQDEYWERRRQGVLDDSTSRLYADVAAAIGGSGGVPGGIAMGLKDAIYGQIEQGDLARDYEGLPITMAAQRSRANTYATQNQILKDTYAALMSRGEADALILGRLDEVQRSLDGAGRMTPDNMVRFQTILMEMEVRELISEEGMKDAMRQLTALGARDAGMNIPLS